MLVVSVNPQADQLSEILHELAGDRIGRVAAGCRVKNVDLPQIVPNQVSHRRGTLGALLYHTTSFFACCARLSLGTPAAWRSFHALQQG